MYNKKPKPIERLIENMEILDELVLNPQKGGEIEPIGNKGMESQIPLNVNLFDFREKMDREIRRVCRKIERKLGWEVPDGMK